MKSFLFWIFRAVQRLFLPYSVDFYLVLVKDMVSATSTADLQMQNNSYHCNSCWILEELKTDFLFALTCSAHWVLLNFCDCWTLSVVSFWLQKLVVVGVRGQLHLAVSIERKQENKQSRTTENRINKEQTLFFT